MPAGGFRKAFTHPTKHCHCPTVLWSRLWPSPPSPNPGERDLEIKDATLIFNAVWADLIEKHSRENLRFPREFIWLGGARGRQGNE